MNCERCERLECQIKWLIAACEESLEAIPAGYGTTIKVLKLLVEQAKEELHDQDRCV